MTATLQNPFPGLRSFEPEEEHLFFGREKQIDELLTRLRLTRFLTVVGFSGSGKSSLVRSGVVPALFSGQMSGMGSAWRISVMRPGSDPVGNLAQALWEPVDFDFGDDFDLFGDDEDEEPETDHERDRIARAMLPTTLKRGSRGLVDAVRQLDLDEGELQLVVVDQFEELFRFKRESKGAKGDNQSAAFVKLLLQATAQQDVPIFVILTMRSDFLENCAEILGLTEAINEGQYLVPRMTRDQRRTAITGPVAVSGAQISSRLAIRLLNDVGDNPDQLPILQHALMRTWAYWYKNHKEEEPIDLRHYEAIGAMAEALSLHAEVAFKEQGDQEGQEVARRTLSALTEKGSDGRGIRRPTTVREICRITGVGEEEVLACADRFRRQGRSFLVPSEDVPLTSETILDISHESLMRVWTRLSHWVEEEAQSARRYCNLAQAAARHQEGIAGLYRDPELQMALRWREEARPNAYWAERYDASFERAIVFLENSREERDRGEATRELQRKQQLRRTRLFAGFSAMFTLLVLAMGIVAVVQAQDAQQEKRVANEKRIEAEDARKLAVVAQNRAESANRTIEQQKNEAIQLRDDAQHNALQAELSRSQAEQNLTMAREARQKAETERSRTQAAKQETDHALKAANEAKHETERALGRAETGEKKAREEEARAMASLVRSRNLMARKLAQELAGKVAGLQQRDPELAALYALKAFQLAHDHAPAGTVSRTVPFIHEALRLALRGLDPNVEWAYNTSDPVRAIELGKDGLLLAGTENGNLLQFSLDEMAQPVILQSFSSGIRSLAISPNKPTIAVGLNDGFALVDLARAGTDGEAVVVHAMGEGAVNDLAFVPDGKHLAVAMGDSVRLFDRGDVAVVLRGFGSKVSSLAFQPETGAMLVGGSAGAALINDYTRSYTYADKPLTPEPTRSVAFSKNGLKLAVGSDRGEIRIWSAQAINAEPTVKSGHLSPVNELVFGPAGESLVSASSDHTIRLWNLSEEGTTPVILREHGTWVWSVSFSPDGRILYSAGADERIRRWIIPTADLSAALCTRISREMTSAEWQELVHEGTTAEARDILGDILKYQKPCAKANEGGL